MGYWKTTRNGASLQTEDTGLVWGDAPADVLSGALDQIREIYRTELGREPLLGELRAGLEFSLMGLPDTDSAEALA